MAAAYNFTIEQGATLIRRFVWKDKNNQPINLVGCTAKMQLRETYDKAPVLTLTTETGEIVLGGVDGTVLLKIAATATAALSFTEALYDLVITDSEGAVTRLAQGKVKLSRGVTSVGA